MTRSALPGAHSTLTGQQRPSATANCNRALQRLAVVDNHVPEQETDVAEIGKRGRIAPGWILKLFDELGTSDFWTTFECFAADTEQADDW